MQVFFFYNILARLLCIIQQKINQNCCIIPSMLNKELRPEINSRRSEWTAWGLALVVFAAIALMKWQLGSVPSAAWIFGGILLFAAFSISLGNWVDRSTVMRLDINGISFENGLRKVALRWHEVKKVNVLPARWGKSVQVIGEKSHFEFRTLGEVEYKGEVQGKVGFAEGDAALKEILKQSGLTLVKEEKGRYYYARV